MVHEVVSIRKKLLIIGLEKSEIKINAVTRFSDCADASIGTISKRKEECTH